TAFDPEPLKKSVNDEAQDILADPTEGIDAFVWRPAVGTEEEQEGKRYFRNLLGYVSTLPAPVPQLLNLSLCFKLPAGDLSNGDWIFAAPEFEGGTLGDVEPIATGPGNAQLRPAVAVYPWGYEPGPHAVTAYTVPWMVVSSETSDKSFIDFNSY